MIEKSDVTIKKENNKTVKKYTYVQNGKTYNVTEITNKLSQEAINNLAELIIKFCYR